MPAKSTGHRRAQVRYPILGVCEQCGEKPAFDRHHKNGDVFDNTRSNLAFLCRRCHMSIDGRLGQSGAGGVVIPRTHCKRGHSLSGGNLYLAPSGERVCRECRRARDRARRARHRK